MNYCPNCGKGVENMQYCSNCGTSLQTDYSHSNPSKSKLTALLLCLFVGGLGIHRFYVGKSGTGILMLLCTVPSFLFWGYITSVSELNYIYGMVPLKLNGTSVMISTIMMIIFGLWPLIDLIRIATDNFSDSNGDKLS